MKRANFDLSLRVGRGGEAREEKNKTERSAAGKEKGNGGHFLEKQKGKARQSQVGRKQKGNGGHSPEKQKGTGGAKGEWRTL